VGQWLSHDCALRWNWKKKRIQVCDPTALTQKMFSPLPSTTHACLCQKQQKKLKVSLEGMSCEQVIHASIPFFSDSFKLYTTNITV